MSEPISIVVREVQNVGGFFGGDTITLTAVQLGGDTEQTFTIDERAFTNVVNRYTITAGMLLVLTLSGERVDRAELLGATEHAELRAALLPPDAHAPLDGPQIVSYHCPNCALWIVGEPNGQLCRICQQPLAWLSAAS